MKKRHSFLLLEIVIALGIMASVMILLFTSFYEAIKAKNILQKEKEKAMHLQRLRLRFTLLFQSVTSIEHLSDHMYKIKYQGGVDFDPSFRTDLESTLCIRNNVLTLTSWPLKKALKRQEVLSKEIHSIRFEFFDEKTGNFLPDYPAKKPFMMQVILNNEERLPLFL